MPSTARILITGGSGFIGTNLVDLYVRAGHTVASLDTAPPKNSEHADIWQNVDLLDSSGLAGALRSFRPTHVFHLGARTDLGGTSSGDYLANSVGTKNVIDAIRAAEGVERVVFTSSMLVCRMGYRPRDEFDICPSTPYGESKVEMERIIRASEIGAIWVIGRPTSIWGPWFGVPYNDFFRAVISGRYVHPRGPVINQSFGYVGNTVHELDVLAAAEPSRVSEKTFFLADYPPLEFGAWADAIALHAKAGPIRRVPMSLLRAVASTGSVLQRVTGKPMPLTSFRLNNLVTENVQDLSSMALLAGELPFTSDEGIRLTLEWMAENDGRALPA
ncbi:MAG: NAD-dependent epimerase/dehydratase family protein [Thermoleophilia bacterium]|nr:NAD-dependent epimerase/dehydratase family protein [Thermoleophilia bacterium]